jgi:hypothetical protein
MQKTNSGAADSAGIPQPMKEQKTNSNAGDSMMGTRQVPEELEDFSLDELRVEAPPRKLSVEADFDLDALRAGSDAEVAAAPDFNTVEVRKPKSTWCIYVPPEWRIDMYLLQPDEAARGVYTHALLPKIARMLPPRICRKYRLVPYADRENAVFLWPIVLENATGELNSYSDSALRRLIQGAGQWCWYEADQAHQRYKLEIAHEQIAPPEWPASGLEHLVKAAFRGSVISDMNAEILRQRMGKVVK